MDATSVPFAGGSDGYAVFRIPALARTRAGTLLAFAEAREGPDDSGVIETVVRRSTDRGRSWGPLHVVARADRTTWGNPAPVALPDGRVLLLTCTNGADVTEADITAGRADADQTRRVWVQHGDDDGRSWSPPREITAEAKRAGWRWYATGPGPGALTRDGRVVVPANHSVAPAPDPGGPGGEAGHYGGHALCSDDEGATWTIGFVAPGDGEVNPNESAAAVLPDGRLYLNCRNEQGRAPGTRADAYSTDGGRTLTAPYRPQPGLVTPVVQGAVLALPDGRLLYSGPNDPVDRVGMGVRVSVDDGATWGPPLVVDGRPAAYSSLVLVDPGTVGLLWETGERRPDERLAFVRVPVGDLG